MDGENPKNGRGGRARAAGNPPGWRATNEPLLDTSNITPLPRIGMMYIFRSTFRRRRRGRFVINTATVQIGLVTAALGRLPYEESRGRVGCIIILLPALSVVCVFFASQASKHVEFAIIIVQEESLHHRRLRTLKYC